MLAPSFGTYSGAERFQSAFVGAKVEILPTKGGRFTASAFRVELNQLWVAGSQESGPRIKYSAQNAARSFVTFLTSACPEVWVGGEPMPPSGFVRHPSGHAYHERTTGPTNWGVISLPSEEMATTVAAVSGEEFASPADIVRSAVPPHEMAGLLRLHAAVGKLAEKAPDVVAFPEVARRLEQSFIGALAACHVSGEHHNERWAVRSHQTVLRRFRRVLVEHSDRALYIPEVCKAIGVPDRTLRLCCHEQLGMSPKHYLAHRRMHLARRALRRADPDAASVTEIATQFGFWHFGRFAGTYRSLFAEAPAATLKRATDL